jgi:hypothetical protein
MSSIVLECPHCGIEKVGFNLMHEIPSTSRPSSVIRRVRALLVCSNCEEVVIGVFDILDNATSNIQNPSHAGVDPRRIGWVLTASYPRPSPPKIPSHIPDELRRIFLQASNALKRREPDASGVMSRRVVDISTQRLLGDQFKEYKAIRDRIDALADQNKLTSELKDWAHQLRLGGKDAEHDIDPFTMAQARELLDFVALYLRFLYSLPGLMKESRERAGKQKSGSGLLRLRVAKRSGSADEMRFAVSESARSTNSATQEIHTSPPIFATTLTVKP